MELYHNETEHTVNESCVHVINNKVYQETYEYRDIMSKEQLSTIVEKLTIENEFILDSVIKGTIKLTHPKSNLVEYNISTEPGNMGIYKKTLRLVGDLEM